MTDKATIATLCVSRLHELKLYNETWRKRLESELKDVNSKNDAGYFLKLRQECIDKKVRYENEHNSVVPYLLRICNEFDIDKPPAYDYGEYPDIDIDYIDGVRDYLKEDFAKKRFGKDYVCNIANYNTFGMRGALTDMARIFGLDHDEVKAVTKKLKDKDEDGKAITWDQALEMFDDLKAYCDAHPDVADAARRMVGRIRGRGQHASGLVVSSVPIKDYIPLIQGKDESPASAWIEGLHGTDLSTVGFIKFDFLGLDGNQKIADACKMACQSKKGIISGLASINRTIEDIFGGPMGPQKACDIISDAIGDKTVCALPGLQPNGEPYPSWSDTRYLNDPKALAMASAGDLRMVFQFDGSPGIRRLAKEGGVDSFDDLVAYTALYRPGPMKLKYHEKYINRKRGLEQWSVHPALAEGPGNLSFTYGVLTYQEQIMRMLNTVGQVPLQDCETVRKAISKKKIEKFEKYKKMFIANGQHLGFTVAELEHLWEQIEAFAGYGFNLSHAVGYTYISSRMLWLKAHLTDHFFASMFTHTKASGPKDYNKLKEYKREADKYKVKMAGLDINKSKQSFVVNPEDEVIYYGFEKIKGIGEEAAVRLEQQQPYASFEDFLRRFGTAAKVVEAVIALGCFKDADPTTLYHFYEHFKKFETNEKNRIKRYETTKAKIEKQLAEETDETKSSKLLKKLEVCIANKEKKDQFVEWPTLAQFQFEEKKGKENEEFLAILNTVNDEVKETAYYGYVWHHPFEKCPDYQGLNFEEFVESGDRDGYVEAIIRNIEKKQTKVTFYSVQLEDGVGWKRKCTIWEDDYERFADELKVNNIVRLWVDEPHPKYKTFTLHQIGTRWKKPARCNDHRVIKLN